ncbi:MAG: coproporphyrinogen dehydrogenase HemZ, partial [Syntrophomonadaceae bacterium]|nr:coproporphyrinogen dehydrogenase HemZ [Syntrophomonadaceae bacterium]
GVLSGVRPSKIVHRWLDQGMSRTQIEEGLQRDYRLSPDKARRLVEVASRQRPWLLSGEQAKRLVSVYIGIPFCPSRCLYCSFPSYPLPSAGSLMDDFLRALGYEVRTVGEALRRQLLAVQTIYVGGGTPTSLPVDRLARLLDQVNQHLRHSGTYELTVEGGRPETLSEPMLKALRAAGVTRLSINPQTLQDETLRTIGRHHTAGEVIRAFWRAREVGIPCLNMDLILGLPGETMAELEATLAEVARLEPDNLTVHPLAIKRASRLKAETSAWTLPHPRQVVEMFAGAEKCAQALGLYPYYLYRQKNTLGNLENTGYARPGYEGVYNIQIIEERQTIVGLGAGAGSKWVDADTGALSNSYHPKEPAAYVARVEELARRQVDKLFGMG